MAVLRYFIKPYILLFKPINANRHLYSSNDLNYFIPNPTKDLFKGSMSYSGANLWNKIPNDIKQSRDINNLHQTTVDG